MITPKMSRAITVTSDIPQEFRTMREMKSKEMNIKFILILASIVAMASVRKMFRRLKAESTTHKSQCGYYHYRSE